jgi:hypothetical protein
VSATPERAAALRSATSRRQVITLVVLTELCRSMTVMLALVTGVILAITATIISVPAWATSGVAVLLSVKVIERMQNLSRRAHAALNWHGVHPTDVALVLQQLRQLPFRRRTLQNLRDFVVRTW